MKIVLTLEDVTLLLCYLLLIVLYITSIIKSNFNK